MNGVVDHLGNRYKNVQEMCDTYGVHYQTYFTRRRRGFPLRDCLLGRPPRKKGERKRVGVKPKEVVDHLGRPYSSLATMCQAYNVDYNVFQQRQHNGFTLEECLKGRPRKKKATKINKREKKYSKGLKSGGTKMKKVKDHLGKEYDSLTQMCKAYGVPYVNYNNRQNRGCSVEECLRDTTPIDHNGVVYASVKEMCAAYYITCATYYYRKRKGCSVEECLTGIKPAITVYDHLGKGYISFRAMCAAYHIDTTTYYNRKNAGCTLEECLTGVKVLDHLGKSYNSLKEMCAFYYVDITTYYKRKKRGCSLEQCLNPTKYLRKEVG